LHLKINFMKTFCLLLFLLVASIGHSQVYLSSRHTHSPLNYKKKSHYKLDVLLEKFKKTETIFLLSDIYDIKEYEKILRDSWTVTPFQVVKLADFDYQKYLNSQYSIAQIKTFTVMYGTTPSNVQVIFDLSFHDSEATLEKLEKLAPEKRKNKLASVINANTETIAYYWLLRNDDFLGRRDNLTNRIFEDLRYDESEWDPLRQEIILSCYKDDVFHNYKLGFLKNYLQQMNELIEAEQHHIPYEDVRLPELKKLTQNTLYIPSYLADEISEPEVLGAYNYRYEIISDEELNTKILNNDELYYLSFNLASSLKWFEVINSKTGTVLYRNFRGSEYLLGEWCKIKHIESLNSAIKKASKK
jgi:hypothetical protein